MRALEFHHLDPMEKDFGISRTLTKSMATLIAETDKCILLCSNCHAEEHQKLFDLGYSQFNPDIWPHNRRVTGSSPVCPARVATTQRKCCGWFWSAFHQYINKSALICGCGGIGRHTKKNLGKFSKSISNNFYNYWKKNKGGYKNADWYFRTKKWNL